MKDIISRCGYRCDVCLACRKTFIQRRIKRESPMDGLNITGFARANPKGMIDTHTWTEDMRKKGAEALRMIKQEEEKAFKVLSRIA